MRKTGFDAIVGNAPRVLILGSMPGEASLKQQQYYGHARNLFWEIMGSLFEFDYTLAYKYRTQQLINNNIALWDVIEKCHRQGSLDSSIVKESIKVNDFRALFTEYPTIEYIFFNGGKAESEFRKRVLSSNRSLFAERHYELLPSTSPANARMTKSEKLDKWQKIRAVLSCKK